MAFKGYAQPGQFRPRTVQDQTKKMKDQADATRRGMDAVYQQQQSNLTNIQQVTQTS